MYVDGRSPPFQRWNLGGGMSTRFTRAATATARAKECVGAIFLRPPTHRSHFRSWKNWTRFLLISVLVNNALVH